jgi:hypothetical protein
MNLKEFEKVVELTEQKDAIYNAVNILDIIENMLENIPFENIEDIRAKKKVKQIIKEIQSAQYLFNAMLNENFDKMRDYKKYLEQRTK